MHRFFLHPDHFTQQRITFPPPQARQIRQVLRLSPGQRVVALDDLGWAYELELVEVSANAVHAWLLRKFQAPGEPRTHLTMLVCLSQREKFEWILQKCTEVGVSAFVPVISARSLVRSASQVENKMERWHAILREAAEQCGRGRIPQILTPVRFPIALEQVPQGTARVLCWEGLDGIDLGDFHRQFISPQDRWIVLIGPEGGLENNELNQALYKGFTAISLGTRILRMETAALVAASLVMFLTGELSVLTSNMIGNK